ncbi:O-methyltransferase involved in polyketide biosynthesis [Pseudomonas nitritireducens]|uniref:O-methyltransferase involved in polyketide biosynthesis n=1 Tax=Pseudomonas nitroreducens TaxID=46680 RepID=A0A7W7P0I4_PSENT|nr:class I SAM-dependent methyltransferase [Pseudomonas nitritireducens]MBB4862669.1 O-methyltransferase involved in polyketide biosynthesis [Pseudomonas nitritireducens]
MERIALRGTPETLLITLYAKAKESELPDSLLRDHFSRQAVAQIDYDFARLRIGRAEQVGIALRAKLFDDWVRDFLARHPSCVVLQLGCGLDSRVFRIDPPSGVQWFEVDFPQVIALREKLYPPRENCHLLATPLTAPDWWRAVPTGRPVLLVAEGVLPYIETEEVFWLLRSLTAHFGGGELLFDGYSRLGIRLLQWNPMIRRTGAVLHWGIDEPWELEQQVPALRFSEAIAAYDREQIARLSLGMRLLYEITLAIPALRRMGRLLRYRFGA